MVDKPSSTLNLPLSRDAIRESIKNYERTDFQVVLSELLDNRPDLDTIKKLARNSPTRWANVVKIFAMLSGYTEKTEATVKNVHYHMHEMSDAELEIRATQLRIINQKSVQKMDSPLVIDHEVRSENS